MARHNRDGHGSDQRGFDYTVSYQPDWLKQVKVTRLLPTGRQSTMTLFRSPSPPERAPGRQVRTIIRSEEQGLFLEIALTDPDRAVRRVIIETEPPDGEDGPDGTVQFTLEDHR